MLRPRQRLPDWLIAALLALLAISLAWRTETSRDFGFHIATGRWILAHHAWPKVDSFTYPLAGKPYVDMHGLFQLALAAAYRCGMAGVGLLRVTLVLLCLALLWLNARSRGVRSATLLGGGLGLALCAWELRFMARPELASDLCLAAQLLLLRRHNASGAPRWLFAMIPLQLVWVYSHALSLFGIVVLGLYAAASLVRGVRARRIDWLPWIALALATGVMFLNPYGARGVAFLWDLRTRLQSGNAFGESIAELMSPFSGPAAGVVPLVAFKVLLAATAIVVAARLRRLSLFDVAIVAVFGFLAATHVRNVGLFVIASLPIALEAATGVAAWLAACLKPRRRSALAARLGIATTWGVAAALAFATSQAISGATYAANHRPMAFGCEESPAVFPIATLARLESARLEGPLFNTLDLGGYLIQHRAPAERVFIDGRLEVVGEPFYREYSSILTGEGWDRMVARYAPRSALISTGSRALIEQVHRDTAWALMDADGAAVLFARRLPAHQAAIDSSAARLALWDMGVAVGEEALAVPARASWFRRMFGRHHVAFEEWGRGNAFTVLGMFEAARREYRRALLHSDQLEPGLVKSYVSIALKLKRFDEARTWCVRWVELAPRDEQARDLLARLESR